MRTQVKRAAGVVLKAAAGAADRIRPPAPGVTVLIYHRVGARTPVPVDLPTPLFRDQMAAIADRVVHFANGTIASETRNASRKPASAVSW